MTPRLAAIVAVIVIAIVLAWPIVAAMSQGRQVEAVDLRTHGGADSSRGASPQPLSAD